MDLDVLKNMNREEQQAAIQAVEKFIEELNQRSMQDGWCLEMAADVAKRIGAYEEAVKDLTQEQKEAIEAYIAACEELEYSYVYIGYAIGREHQRMGIPCPPFFERRM